MKTVLVLGASGDIGISIVSELLKKKYRVIAQSFQHAERLAKLSTEFNVARDSLMIFSADLTDINERKEFMENISKTTTTLHGLVNVIGGGRPCNIQNLTLEDWDFSVALNLTVPFHCLQLAIPLLKRAKGSVVNFSSVAAYTGGAFGPHYASVKSGVLGLTRSAARELGHYGIRVNAISPGPVDTEMTHSLPAEALKKIIDETPLKQMVSTSEIASAVNYLLDEATSTTGQSLVIDGGRFFN